MTSTPQLGTIRKDFPDSFAILFASAGTGGEERFLVELAIAMQRTPTKPVVLNLKAATPYRADLERHSVALFSGIAPWRFDLIGAWRLFRLLRTLKPDVLLVNSNRQSVWLGTLAGMVSRVPIMLLHTHDHLGKNAFTLRMGSALADGVMAAAQKHREDLCDKQGLKPTRVVTVSPGIHLARTDRAQVSDGTMSSARTNRVVGIIAGLRPEKDHETFLRAAALVRQTLPHVEFHIIGDGPERPRLERLAAELGLASHTRFLGWQEVNGRLFSTLDVLALSSTSETFPAVLLEAFNAGVPVVATDVGSVAELLGSPACGLLVPSGQPEALGAALITLLEQEKFAQVLIEHARQRVKFFSADRFCSDVLRLARELHHAKYPAL